jgi:hypothetical protein
MPDQEWLQRQISRANEDAKKLPDWLRTERKALNEGERSTQRSQTDSVEVERREKLCL